MKITKIETIRTKPIPFPAPYGPSWIQPGGKAQTHYVAQFLKVHTDEGITGYGPVAGEPGEFAKNCLIGADPFKTESFWSAAMRGYESAYGRGTNGGLDVALWDIIGKAAGLPVYKLLGTRTDKIKVYAATTRLLSSPEEHVEQVADIESQGFKAVKLRFHRPDWRDDVKVAEAVRKAFPDMTILVDANQNNHSPGYNYWPRKTALAVGRALQDLGVYIFEEPLKLRDIEGLAMLAGELDMLISGGEHATDIYYYKDHLSKGAYDVFQPDLILGDMGISGIRKFGVIADYYGKMVVPHVSLGGNFALSFPAAAAAVAGLDNCPILEFLYDPPFLTEESQQFYVKEKLRVDKDGYVKLSQQPGIGVEIDEQALAKYM